MVDVTNAPVPTGGSPFDVPGDLKALADHFGNQFSVANAAALPTSGNWAGRVLTTVDTGRVYRWNGTWQILPFAAAGVVSAGTDSAGRITVAHGLGVQPKAVTVSIAADAPVIPHWLTAGVDQIGATTFRITVWRLDGSGGPLASNPTKFYWTAVA